MDRSYKIYCSYWECCWLEDVLLWNHICGYCKKYHFIQIWNEQPFFRLKNWSKWRKKREFLFHDDWLDLEFMKNVRIILLSKTFESKHQKVRYWKSFIVHVPSLRINGKQFLLKRSFYFKWLEKTPFKVETLSLSKDKIAWDSESSKFSVYKTMDLLKALNHAILPFSKNEIESTC